VTQSSRYKLHFVQRSSRCLLITPVSGSFGAPGPEEHKFEKENRNEIGEIGCSCMRRFFFSFQRGIERRSSVPRNSPAKPHQNSN
jgi:hypothetical protein